MNPMKPHLEFFRLDMNSGWETPPGYPPGIEQKILAGTLDETNKAGSRTRLLRFQPGVYTPTRLSTTIGRRSFWSRAT